MRNRLVHNENYNLESRTHIIVNLNFIFILTVRMLRPSMINGEKGFSLSLFILTGRWHTERSPDSFVTMSDIKFTLGL